jgi:hypothetical protein
MRSSPAVRRAPVHQFSDGAAVRAPKRNLEQALKHETIPAPADELADPVRDEPEPSATSIPVDSRPLKWTATFSEKEVAAIALRPLTTEDVDQLWDWARQDSEGVKACFGSVAKNSRELFNGIGKLAEMQTRGESWINSITRDASLIGFVLIAPIQRPVHQPPVGTVHLYIAPEARGEISAIVSGMLNAFDSQHGPMTLSVIVNRPEWVSVLEPLGFEASTVLTRPAAVTSSAHGS